jgi:phosphoglycolate phosphatase
MAVTMVHLPIQTSDGRPVAHAFHRQDQAPRGLLICLPGQSYGVDGPLLYYPKRILQSRGWDTLGLTYSFQTTMSGLTAEAVAASMAEAKAAVQMAIRQRTYPQLCLVGKSLGAGVLAWLCREEESLGRARAAFLTPLLGTPIFDTAFVESRSRAYVAIGTRDRFYDPAALDRLRSQRPFELRVVEGQDHGLDFNGSLEASLGDLQAVVGDLVEFFDPPRRDQKVQAA